MIHAAGTLRLRPRDMAKPGYLYLTGGRWQGQQILSPEWIAASTRESVSIPWNSLAEILHKRYAAIPESHGDGYGYLWWLKTYDVDGKPVDAVQATVGAASGSPCFQIWTCLATIPEGAAVLDGGTCDGNLLFKAMKKAGAHGCMACVRGPLRALDFI